MKTRRDNLHKFNDFSSFRSYLLSYTLCFAVLFSAIAAGFLIRGKSFVYEARMGDGLRQHYVALAYYGKYLRLFLKNLFLEHRIRLPMWDFSIGYGSDILTTLHYYAIGDPLNLLSALVPYRYTEYLYCALIVLRMYLSGVTFSLYSRYHKNSGFPTLLGALLYAFCQWNLVAGFKHPFFINPCIYFPLMLLGVDKIYKKEKPYLYIVTLAVSAMSNFYFFYMLGIFTVLYAVYRYFMIYGKLRAKTLLPLLGQFAGYSVIGLLISSVIFFPSLGAVLGTDRIGAKNFIIEAYRTEYYHNLIPALIGQFESHFTIIGISSVGILGLLLLFAKRKKNTALKIGFLMCMLFLSVPYIAHMLNGFSYVTNRWCWALAMLMSYAFVKMYPELFSISKKERLGILGVLLLWCLYVCTDSYARTLWNLCAVLLVLAVWLVFAFGKPKLPNRRKFADALLLAGIAMGTFLNIYNCFYNADIEDVNTSQFADAGSAYKQNVNPALTAVSEIENIEDHRFEQGASGILQNAQVMAGLNGGQFFFSLANGNISEFQNELYPYKPLGQNFYNANSRAYILKLLSDKYFIGSPKHAPYGFKKKQKIVVPSVTRPGKMRNIYIYKDPDSLPFVYAYDDTISRSDYEKMNVLEKQQALLQGAVLEESSLPKCAPEDLSYECDYTITPLEGCELSGNSLHVTEDMASCLLEFESLPECEVYAAIDNLQYYGYSRRRNYSDEEWNALSPKEQKEILVKDEKIYNDFALYVSADINENYVNREIHMVTDRNNFYNGRHNFLTNLGYTKKPVTGAVLTVQKKGDYSFDDLSIYCQPMHRLSAYTKKLKEDPITHIHVKDGNVSCQAELSGRRAVVFSVPYSEGWSATVNGEKAELKKANTMFMALELDAGSYDIRLHYRTPHIRLFFCMSLLGLLLFLGLICFRRGKAVPASKK